MSWVSSSRINYGVFGFLGLDTRRFVVLPVTVTMVGGVGAHGQNRWLLSMGYVLFALVLVVVDCDHGARCYWASFRFA